MLLLVYLYGSCLVKCFNNGIDKLQYPNMGITNFWSIKAIYIFVNFGNTLCIMKIFHSKILVFCIRYVFSMSLFKYFKPVSKNSLPSPTGNLSHTIPSSSIVAANKEVSKVLPAVTEHPSAQSVSLATQRGYYTKDHWELRGLAWTKCCSTILQERFPHIEIVHGK